MTWAAGCTNLRTGRPKLRFVTRAGAKEHLRRMKPDAAAGMQPYRCDVCDMFHLGHYPDSRKARSKLRNRHRTTEGDTP